MIISLLTGDVSGDGHNQRDTTSVEVNCTVEELKEFYKAGCEKLGHNYDEFFDEYESNTIPLEAAKVLEELDYDFPEYSKSKEGYSLWIDDWCELYMLIANHGSGDKLEYSWPQVPSIDIGGYGLYH